MCSVLHQSGNHNLCDQAVHLRKKHEILENIRIPFQVGPRSQENLPEHDALQPHTNQVRRVPSSHRHTCRPEWVNDRKCRKPRLLLERQCERSPRHLPGHVCSGRYGNGNW